MFAACLPESFLPGWFRGEPETEEQLAYEADDSAAGVEAPSARDAISAGHRTWSTAYEKKNFSTISLLYSRDCKICPAGSRTAYGRRECMIGWESLTRTGVQRVSFSDTVIESCNGEVVSEASYYHMYGADSKPIDQGKHMMVWKKTNNKWFIHMHIFSSKKPREKTPTDFVSEACLLWEYAYFGRDFPTLSSLYTEECIVCPPAWPQVEGNMRTERFWARFPSMGVDHVDRSVVSVEEMGPGYVFAELRYTMYDYRNGVIDIGKCVTVYKKEKDGRWCVHTEMFNSDASLPSVSTEDEKHGHVNLAMDEA